MKLLTIILDLKNSSETDVIKELIQRFIKHKDNLEIIITISDLEVKNFEKDTGIYYTNKSIEKIIEEIDSEYVLFLRDQMILNSNNLDKIMNEVKTNFFYKYISRVATKELGNKLVVEKTEESESKIYNKIYDKYGVIYKVDYLIEFLRQKELNDYILASYIAYYKLPKFYQSEAYLISEYDSKNNIAYNGYYTLNQFISEEDIEEINKNNISNIIFYRQLILNGKYLLTKAKEEEINISLKNFNIESVEHLKGDNDIVANEIIRVFIKGDKVEYLFKTYKDRELFYSLSITEDKEKFHDNSKVIKFNDYDSKNIMYLNINRLYKDKEKDDDHLIIDWYNKINKNSNFLFMDRTNLAGDNAEELYRYCMNSGFENISFAVSKTSPDWERLEFDGFNLVDYSDRKKFRQSFIEADVYLSSQAYCWSTTKGLNTKSVYNSRFVYLQHGILFNDMSDWILSKPADLFLTTSPKEYEFVKKLLPHEAKRTGLPRLQGLNRKNPTQKEIAFIPTWRFDLKTVSDATFKTSLYYRKIMEFLNSDKLIDYLDDNDVILKVKIHPNFKNREKLFSFKNKNIVLTNERYKNIFENSDFILTDYSSAAYDASYIRVPIAFYQWDEKSFHEGQPYERLFSYHDDGIGPVFTELDETIDYIIQNKYKNEDFIYKKRKKEFFKDLDQKKICHDIMEEVLKL